MFNQLKASLPKGIGHAQERFIKQVYIPTLKLECFCFELERYAAVISQVYDIASATTFFGVHEYIAMSIMCLRIGSLEYVRNTNKIPLTNDNTKVFY